MNLAELEARVRRELTYIAFPDREWMPPPVPGDTHVYDVLIVGAGQSGLATAYGLMREGVRNLLVLDAAPEGQEGPWTSFARMITLRTPKMLSGLDFGNPALSPRAWFEARFGAQAWEDLGKIPRELWQDYLKWYRRALEIPVRNEMRVSRISPEDERLAVTCEDGTRFLARKVVLCTGMDGSGRWEVPAVIRNNLPKDRYAHTAHDIDFGRLRDRRIGVLGNGASSFDNAATALEHGAEQVILCLRKPDLPRTNIYKWMESPGFLAHYASLPDVERWRIMRYVTSMSQPPPQDTYWRCTRHERFALHPGTPWNNVAMSGDEILVRTPKGELVFDFLIAGTGIIADLRSRPELAGFADKIACWNDKFTPPAGEEDPYLGKSPYLGDAFEFVETTSGEAPFLRNIHNFTYGATLSIGLSASSISGMRYGVPRLVRGITRDFFRDDIVYHTQSMKTYCELEIQTLGLPADPDHIPTPASPSTSSRIAVA